MPVLFLLSLLLRLTFLRLLLSGLLAPLLLLPVLLRLGFALFFSLLGLAPFQFLESLLGRLSFLHRLLLLRRGFALFLLLLCLPAFELALF